MPERISFHEKRKGSLAENEDWWRLVITEDGARQIEHEWSYVDPYGRSKPNSGTKTYAVDDFLKGDHDGAAKAKLQGLLKERGEA